jgi:MarR family transcriptional regulator, temperature-dependent positive regulator of motility
MDMSIMSKLDDYPGHLIRRFHQIAVAAFVTETEQAGVELTAVQYAALFVLRDNEGIDQATLAGLIAYDRVTIGGVISRLESRGYLERKNSTEDRRARILRLTRQGRAVLTKLAPAVHQAQEVMLQGLNKAERAELMKLLRKVTDAGNKTSRAPLQSLARAEVTSQFSGDV